MWRIVVAVAALSLVSPRDANAEDWPQFRGPRGDGTWRTEGLPERFPEGGLKTVWKQSIGGGYAGISVVGDRVYTLDRQTEPAEVERIVCLSAADGKLVWEHRYPVDYKGLDYGNGPRSQPTVHDGRVYSVGSLGHVCCLDAATGKLIWSRHYQDDWQGRLPTWGYAASPLVLGDRVILQPGGDAGASVVAVDRLTGVEIWRTLSDPAGYATATVYRTQEREQLAVWTPTHIRGIAADTGAALWGVPYEVTYGVSIAKPIVHENLVLVAGYWEGSKAVRLGAEVTEVKLAWEENKFLRGLMSQPLYREGHVYLLDKHYGLTCFELSSGKKLWDDKHALTPRDRNPQASLVWLGDSDRMLALNAEGELVLARLTPEGYEELSRAHIIGFTWAHPAFAGQRVYARSDTEIVCVDLAGP